MEDADGVIREHRIKAILEVLQRGLRSANKLKQIVNNNGDRQDDDNESSPRNHLINEIISSFDQGIFLLTKYPIHHQSSSSSHHGLPPDKRDSCQRKINMETWKKESEKEREEDGHQWRKYGHKEIQDEKYPRNYFRCTHKH
ncbi:hypothetical protein PIB30_029081 [Stylosanthes scabra]|uniref:WRKY domain-containing protein n=1 Tax=Stylosanthes scabra TaxID=79078 RepID=A0ABU6SB18_9FABA|nr:hypothetical protein [Stylosanthes scabra]